MILQVIDQCKTDSGVLTTYAYDPANQLRTSRDPSGVTTYNFDPAGNLEGLQAPSNQRTTHAWDNENRLTRTVLPSAVVNTALYNADGLRVALQNSMGVRKFIWDEQNYLAETDESDATQVVYTNEPHIYGNLVSQYRRSGMTWLPSYCHFDAVGSTRTLTNNSEVVTDSYLYKSFGELIASSGSTVNTFRWFGAIGYYFDSDCDSFYVRARHYQPSIARWLSHDPLGYDGDIKLYEYLANNPLIKSDPTGLGRWEKICLDIVKALKGKSCNQLFSFCSHIGRHGDFGANGAKICFCLYDLVCPTGNEQLTNAILREACKDVK